MTIQADRSVDAQQRGAGVPARADLTLVQTKLARPRVPPGFLPRPQVEALLDHGTRGPLTVVCAGAGWGKTLATAGWAASESRHSAVAWVGLDSRDNDPRVFWSYVLAALRAATRIPGDNPLARLAPGLSHNQDYLDRLVAGLEVLPEPVVLVLDDFHLVNDREVLAGVTTLLRASLDRLRLVLLTRSDPPLPLHRLRLAGELGEVGSEELAFTAAEAAALIGGDGVAVDAQTAELLVERTEGWPAGLRLAAMFLASDRSDRSPADFGGSEQSVAEYLAEEVLADLPPDQQRFLMRTSVPDRLNAALAEELTGESRSQQRLEELAATNTFVVRLGPGQRWYRYHALLREMLLHRLSVQSPGVVPELHRRAARWFSTQGHPLEAIRHALDAQDWALAGRLLVTQALPLTLSVERAALDRQLARIPSEQLTTRAELAVAAAARMLYAGRLLEIQAHLERAEGQVSADGSETAVGTRIALSTFAMAVARTRGDNDGLVESASRVLDEVTTSGGTLPAAAGYRTVGLANLGTGLLWAGRVVAAQRCLEQGLEESEGIALDASRINLLSHLAVAAALADNLTVADHLASQAVQIVDDRGWAPLIQAGTAYLALAMVHFQRNEVDDCLRMLAEGHKVAAPDRCASTALALFEIRVRAALGHAEAARRQLLQLEGQIGDWAPPRLLARWLRITAAEVDLAQGEPQAALARVRLDRPEDSDSPLVPERLVRARALLLVGQARLAEETLAPLHAPALRRRLPVETLLLSALSADRLRDDGRAMQALKAAVEAAEPDGIRRPFVEWEPQHLPRLIERVTVLHPSTARFLAGLDGAVAPSTTREHVGPPVARLTDRELVILQYLPTMLTYPEIGAQLFLSVNTVKTHVRHLYDKLDADTRRGAVLRARELGLLEP